MTLKIAHEYRRVLKVGMQGHEIWALQINLNAAVNSALDKDGAFGPKTKAAVAAFQTSKKLVVDGIAGLATQRALAKHFFGDPERRHKLPPGLLAGIAEGESGFAVGAVNFSVAGGADLGWFQKRVLFEEWTTESIENAFGGPTSARYAADTLRIWRDRYAGSKAVDSSEEAWRLSVLRWNWPAAANKIADGAEDSWQYRETWTDSTGTHSAMRFMNQPAMWIKRIGVPGVETGHQWARHYVDSKVMYVTDWVA